MGYHDDKVILRHLFEKLHHLFACVAVESAGGFIRKQNGRAVHQCTRNGNPLHLPTRELHGFFLGLFQQTNTVQCVQCPLSPFLTPNTGERHGQLHVGENGLVWDQVVALKDKADCVVAVGIPVPVTVAAGGHAAKGHLAAVIAVQPANDIQQCGLARATGAQNGHKLTFPE